MGDEARRCALALPATWRLWQRPASAACVLTHTRANAALVCDLSDLMVYETEILVNEVFPPNAAVFV